MKTFNGHVDVSNFEVSMRASQLARRGSLASVEPSLQG
jgi:hypothetical protein